MNLDELCRKLIEHGLVNLEKLRPNFTERIMREGGGTPVLQHQDADIIVNIKLFEHKIADRIQAYSPEKVEVYFLLQELANHARMNFYKGIDGCLRKEEDRREKRGFDDRDREKIMARLRGLETGFYKSGDIGEPLGLRALSVGVFLSHLNDDERKELGIRYSGTEKRTWEKY